MIKSSFIRQRDSTIYIKGLKQAHIISQLQKKRVHGNDRSFNFAPAATKQVWMAPVMEEKKKQRHLFHNLALAATKLVWMAPVMEEWKKRGCRIPILALVVIEQVSF